MHSIEFQAQHDYISEPLGITVPIELGYGPNRAKLTAKVDTGAEFCLFQRGFGEALGIEVEAGERKELHTANSTFVAFGHEVSLRVLGFDFSLVAYISHWIPTSAEACWVGKAGYFRSDWVSSITSS